MIVCNTVWVNLLLFSHLSLEAGSLILVLLQLAMDLPHLHLGLVVLVVQLLQLNLPCVKIHEWNVNKSASRGSCLFLLFNRSLVYCPNLVKTSGFQWHWLTTFLTGLNIIRNNLLRYLLVTRTVLLCVLSVPLKELLWLLLVHSE